MKQIKKIYAALPLLAVFTSCLLGILPARAQSKQNAVTAIDILFEPDAILMQHAQADNKRLRENYSGGYALDESHQPHISCLQRYVKTADLDKVYAAVAKVLASEKPATWKLTAYKYYFIPYNNLGLAGIVIKPNEALLRYQKKLIDAVAPFTVAKGTAAANSTTKDSPDINQPTMDYVAKFVPDETAEKYSPHVTIGLAKQDFLKKMLGEKFETFTFSLTSASVYHLGNFGTARVKLKSFVIKP